MEAQSIPLRACRLCGAPLEQASYSGVCARCFEYQSRLLAEQQAAEENRPLDPENPRWGIGLGIGTWAFSFAANLIIPLIPLMVWLLPQILDRARTVAPDETDAFKAELTALLLSPTGSLIQVVAIIPAHILTLWFCWAVVTKRGRRPFFESLGLKWTLSPGMSKLGPTLSSVLVVLVILGIAFGVGGRLYLSGNRMLVIGVAAAAAVLVALLLTILSRLQRDPGSKSAAAIAKASFVVGVLVVVLGLLIVLERALPQKGETAFDLLVKSSQQVRIWLALLAVFSAPIVEEVVYRGVLYSALRPRVGVNWAVAIVTLLFAGIHFPQYWGAWAGMAGLTMLSLVLTAVRASTRSLFPCVAIHTLNNVIGAIQILSTTGSSQ